MILRRLHQADDAALMSRISRGDAAAFKEVLHRHQNAVYGFACRMIGDRQEAEDMAQEAFLRLYRSSGAWRPEAALRTFLFRIVKNLCIDYLRKKRPELMETLPEMVQEQTPLDLLEKAIAADRLERAIDNLPANQRAALLLQSREQLPYKQIAEILGVSVGAVESLLVRARQTLRQRLGDSGR